MGVALHLLLRGSVAAALVIKAPLFARTKIKNADQAGFSVAGRELNEFPIIIENNLR